MPRPAAPRESTPRAAGTARPSRAAAARTTPGTRSGPVHVPSSRRSSRPVRRPPRPSCRARPTSPDSAAGRRWPREPAVAAGSVRWLEGRPTLPAVARPLLLPVVDELQGQVEFLALEQADDLLEVILLLSGDAELVALDLCSDALRALVPDDLRDLPGVVLGDAFLESHREAVLLARGLGLARVQDLERHRALDELVLEHVQYRVGTLLAVRSDVDGLVAGPGNRRADAAEIEARADLLRRLVQGVVDFLVVDLGHYVERGFGCHGTQVRRPEPCWHIRSRSRPDRVATCWDSGC